jgi:hypothetical protein
LRVSVGRAVGWAVHTEKIKSSVRHRNIYWERENNEQYFEDYSRSRSADVTTVNRDAV